MGTDKEFSSNCYWFVYAWLNNSEEDFFKCSDDIEYWKTISTWKLDSTVSSTSDKIIDALNLEITWNCIIEIFGEDWKSQHVAFLGYDWKICDQDGPDWPIRTNISLDDLLIEYREKLWRISYKVHSIKDAQKENVEKFINEIKWY